MPIAALTALILAPARPGQAGELEAQSRQMPRNSIVIRDWREAGRFAPTHQLLLDGGFGELLDPAALLADGEGDAAARRGSAHRRSTRRH